MKKLIGKREELEKCCAEIEDKDSLKIQQKWNNKFVRVNKQNIIDMLNSLSLNTSFMQAKGKKKKAF